MSKRASKLRDEIDFMASGFNYEGDKLQKSYSLDEIRETAISMHDALREIKVTEAHKPVFTNGDDQSTVTFNLKNKNTILFIMTYGKCSISFSYSNETLDTNILNTELLDTSYLIDKPLECNYLSFVYKYQFFKDGTFIIAISGNNVDGMATGVYSIQDNYAYLTTKSYLGKNVNLIIRKDECYEIKSLTKNSKGLPDFNRLSDYMKEMQYSDRILTSV